MYPGSGRLDKVPAVTVKVVEDDDGAIGLVSGFFTEMNAVLAHARVVAGKVIRLQEEKDATPALPAHVRALFVGGRSRQEQSRAVRAARCHSDPALAVTHVGVFDQVEAEGPGKKGDGLVVVVNQEGDGTKGWHGNLRSRFPSIRAARGHSNSAETFEGKLASLTCKF